MFRLYDTRLRAVTDIRPARAGELRMYSCGPTGNHPAHLGNLRACLLTDLIRRNAERHGLSVLVCQQGAVVGLEADDGESDAEEEFRAGCSALNLLPADFAPRASEPVERYLGKVIDIHADGTDLPFPDEHNEPAQPDAVPGRDVVRHWVRCGHLLFDGRTMAASAGNAVGLPDLAARGLDPLAARLTFLQTRYRQQLNLTWPTLAAADDTLRGWRELVADWANEPSRPICADYWMQIAAALDDDLDTPGALGTLRTLAADPEIPAGSKFETFASADRVLGLDLVRMVGRPRAARTLPAAP